MAETFLLLHNEADVEATTWGITVRLPAAMMQPVRVARLGLSHNEVVSVVPLRTCTSTHRRADLDIARFFS